MLKTVLDYWQNVELRGDKPKPVWLVVSQGRIQPRGYIYGWSISKHAAQKQADKIIDEQDEQIALLRLH